MRQILALTILLFASCEGLARAQQCLHGQGESTEQSARRRDALAATRAINTIQASQPGAVNGVYLNQADLSDSPYAKTLGASSNDALRRMSLVRDSEVLEGWRLELNVGDHAYWFTITDLRDPCGFRFVSSQSGLILKAEPIR
jgi:hypothetical protein